MEKISVRKNVLLGFSLLSWLMALILLITEKDSDKDAKKLYVTSLVFAAFDIACGIIPFVGWIASVVLLVFYIITVVNTFKGNFQYNVPVIGGIINYFANK